MRRKNAQSIGEILRDYFEDNTELYEKIMESRIRYAWRQLLGPMVMHYTRTIYVRDRVLYISYCVMNCSLRKKNSKRALTKRLGKLSCVIWLSDNLLFCNEQIHFAVERFDRNLFPKLEGIGYSDFGNL